jgi:hypothetical protein
MNTYCGIKEVPKNKKLGSMLECAEKGQVYYWGLKKIDNRILQNIKKPKEITLDKARMNKIKFDTRLKRLTNELEYVKDKEKKSIIKKQIKETKIEVKNATKVFKEAFKLSEERKEAKKTTKKTTKKQQKNKY